MAWRGSWHIPGVNFGATKRIVWDWSIGYLIILKPLTGVMDIAAEIAAKSPLAIRGTKEMIVYARDHSVADSLNYIATWNAAMLMSSDMQEAMMASMQKKTPTFND